MLRRWRLGDRWFGRDRNARAEKFGLRDRLPRRPGRGRRIRRRDIGRCPSRRVDVDAHRCSCVGRRRGRGRRRPCRSRPHERRLRFRDGRGWCLSFCRCPRGRWRRQSPGRRHCWRARWSRGRNSRRLGRRCRRHRPGRRRDGRGEALREDGCRKGARAAGRRGRWDSPLIRGRRRAIGQRAGSTCQEQRATNRGEDACRFHLKPPLQASPRRQGRKGFTDSGRVAHQEI